jgi:hypothetical protein
MHAGTRVRSTPQATSRTAPPDTLRRPALSHRAIVFLAVTALVAFAAQGVLDIAAHAPANDEIAHIPAGWDALAHRRFILDCEQPPLVKEWAALGLLPLRPRWPERVIPRGDQYGWDLGHAFFYHAGNDPHALLMLPRAMCLVLGVALLACVLWWGWTSAGPLVGLTAVSFLAFDPNVLTATTIVYTDLGAALGAVLLLLASRAIVAGSTRWRAARLGAAIGVAACAKFSTLVLLPIALGACAVGLWRVVRPPRGHTQAGEAVAPHGTTSHARSGITLLAHIAAIVVAAAAVVWTAYAFTTGPLVTGTVVHSRLAALLPPEQAARAARLLAEVHVPAPDFWRGLSDVMVHNREGHRAYLLGQFSQTGFLAYFPVALLVKTPLPTLCLLALGCVSLRWRRLCTDEYLVLAAAIVLLGTAMLGHIDIGYRHILALVPLLTLFGARALAAGNRRRTPRAVPFVVVLLLAWQAADAGSVGAHHHAFFNALAGGPSGGHRVLLDSNIDLGQDLPDLARYQREHRIKEFAFAYFGEAEPAAYGIRSRPFTRSEYYFAHPGVYVVSVNELFHLTAPDDSARFAWLRRRPPNAVLGHTLYLYLIPAIAEAEREGARLTGWLP